SNPHNRPCGAGHSYLVIDQNGRVARCQMEIERTVTDITAEDPLGVIRTNQIGFHNLSVDEKDGCRECVWRYWCAGGCPLLTYRVTGRNDVKSPYCNVYQALYPEVLRLEGLRLLKWKDPHA
ncbi:MAG TPA: SPASM domain-containing protein, partial [Anaerolineae bacterium]|nr:SPASM domain-containing protein [Anaerolineae bacterium]